MCCFAGVCTYASVHLVVRMNWIGTSEASNWIGCVVIFMQHDTVADRTLCAGFLFASLRHRRFCCCFVFILFLCAVVINVVVRCFFFFHFLHRARTRDVSQCKSSESTLTIDSFASFGFYLNTSLFFFTWTLSSVCWFKNQDVHDVCACVCMCVWTIYHNNNWSETTMEQWIEEGCMLIARFISTHWITERSFFFLSFCLNSYLRSSFVFLDKSLKNNTTNN